MCAPDGGVRVERVEAEVLKSPRVGVSAGVVQGAAREGGGGVLGGGEGGGLEGGGHLGHVLRLVWDARRGERALDAIAALRPFPRRKAAVRRGNRSGRVAPRAGLVVVRPSEIALDDEHLDRGEVHLSRILHLNRHGIAVERVDARAHVVVEQREVLQVAGVESDVICLRGEQAGAAARSAAVARDVAGDQVAPAAHAARASERQTGRGLRS